MVLVLGPGGQRHYYAHLKEIGDVAPGDKVKAGQEIGTVGTTGNAVNTPPHLHYGIYLKEGPINPFTLMGGKA